MLMSRLTEGDLVIRSCGNIKKRRNITTMVSFYDFNATNKLLFSLIIALNRVFYGRDYLNIALKDQLLRKISSKRTAKIKTLESELCAPPKDGRSQVLKTDGQIEFA
jgi:hypothetical protein